MTKTNKYLFFPLHVCRVPLVLYPLPYLISIAGHTVHVA